MPNKGRHDEPIFLKIWEWSAPIGYSKKNLKKHKNDCM